MRIENSSASLVKYHFSTLALICNCIQAFNVFMEPDIPDLKSQSGDSAIAHWLDFDLEVADLVHPAWAGAYPIYLTYYWSGEEAPSGRHAEARIVWSNDALVVRFVCSQSEPLVVNTNPKLDQKTIGLWDRDVCELFVATDPNEPNRYFEFEAAPTGEWIDVALQMTAHGRDTNWNFHSGMTAASLVAADLVVIAMRIPWGAWSDKPQRGDWWRANLFRCVGVGEARGYITWKPTFTAEPAFHVPRAFGWLNFS